MNAVILSVSAFMLFALQVCSMNVIVINPVAGQPGGEGQVKVTQAPTPTREILLPTPTLMPTSTPMSTATPVPYVTFLNSAGNVNLRGDPSTTNPPIGLITPLMWIEVYPYESCMPDAPLWASVWVSALDTKGWVLGSLLQQSPC